MPLKHNKPANKDGQVGMIDYMTNLHIDKYTFSESML
jgi:hypothetical protein